MGVWQYRNLNAIHRASRPTRPERHDDWDTRPLKVSSFTESVSDVVDARSQYQRVPPWVNQFTKVSSCNSLADFNLLPKSVSVVTAVPSVFSTPTGLVKTLPTSTSKLSLWTHNTMPSETIQNTNGLQLVSKSTENSVVLLPNERDPVVLARACDTRLKVAPPTLHGREETLWLFVDSDNLFDILLLFNKLLSQK